MQSLMLPSKEASSRHATFSPSSAQSVYLASGRRGQLRNHDPLSRQRTSAHGAASQRNRIS
jgi:hypothetical protein